MQGWGVTGQDLLCGVGMGIRSCPHVTLYFGVYFFEEWPNWSNCGKNGPFQFMCVIVIFQITTGP